MTGRAQTPLTFREVLDLPVSVDLRTAARAYGMCLGTAYRLVALGTFPARPSGSAAGTASSPPICCPRWASRNGPSTPTTSATAWP